MILKKGVLNVSRTENKVYYTLQNLKTLFFTVYPQKWV